MTTEIATEHPHIVRKPGTCGGSPIIRGTRISVRQVAVMWREGDTVEEIVQGYTHLQPSWVHDAISYYLDHQQEIEQEIEDNRIENVLAKHGGVMDEKGIVRFPKGEEMVRMANDPLFIRLYLDEDFHPVLAITLRQKRFDCQSAVEAGMLGKTDEEQLEFAVSQGRCLISFNVSDFAALAAAWSMAGRQHAGIVVTPQVGRRKLGWLLGRIEQMLNTTMADEIANVFRYL